APVGWSGSDILWSADSCSVIVTSTYLPLDGVTDIERADREAKTYSVKIDPRTYDLEKVNKSQIKGRQPLDMALDESFDQPPKIYATNEKTGNKTLLLDLNPQFTDLDFAKVEEITWRAADGEVVSGGLYWPLNYRPGNRYPLVIQSHGFNR